MRISSLDYLRAILAMGVMYAHYSLWQNGPGTADEVSTRVEIYRVPLFYLLSGLLIYLFYGGKLALSFTGTVQFLKKRFLRIAPLFYLTTVVTIVLFREIPSPETFVANVTGIFSIYHWDEVIPYGGWSIGNEIVFYLFFPAFIAALRRSSYLFALIFAILLAIYVYFAFWKFDNGVPFIDQWETYTNPINQLFLFACGMGIGILLKEIRIPLTGCLLLFGTACLLFYAYPVGGDRVNLVTGGERLVFTIASVLIIISAYKSGLKLPSIFDRVLSRIAGCSYSIYLLHPIVYRIFMKGEQILAGNGLILPMPLLLTISAVSTLFFSDFVYNHFEKKFAGKKMRPVAA